MNRRTNDQVFDAVAADFIPEHTDITHRIMANLPVNARAVQRLRAGSMVVLVVTLTIMVLLGGVAGTATAIRQMFGFLPGVGMVDRSAPVRVLQAAVTREQSGVMVTVDQVTALPDQTVIHYQVSGIPSSAYPQHLPGSDALGFQKACVEPLFLRLPDGTALTYSGYTALAGNVSVPSYEANFTVKPIPAGIDAVTLVMPCIEGTEQDAIPGVWEFDLRLVAMPEKGQLLPVGDLTAPTPVQPRAAAQPSTNPPAETAEQSTGSDIQFSLDQVVRLPDGDQLYGRLQWSEATSYSVITLDSYELTDAQGQRVPITQLSPDPSQMPVPGSRMVPLAFKVGGPVEHAGPVTLTVDQMTANLPVADTHFILNTEIAPNENRQWLLNQELQAGPYSVRVRSAARLADGYEFTFETGPEIGCVDVYIQGTNDLRGMCGQGVSTVQFDGEVPSGQLTIIIANLEVRLIGSWQATWLPPEATP